MTDQDAALGAGGSTLARLEQQRVALEDAALAVVEAAQDDLVVQNLASPEFAHAMFALVRAVEAGEALDAIGRTKPVTHADVEAFLFKLRIIPATIPPDERAQRIRDAVIESPLADIEIDAGGNAHALTRLGRDIIDRKPPQPD